MFQAYVSSVSDVLEVRCKCFMRMLQVFHADVVKVDRDVAFVAMVVHVCCKLLFPMFYLFPYVCCKCVHLYVAYVSHICYECFI
jgi:hypothetical protein